MSGDERPLPDADQDPDLVLRQIDANSVVDPPASSDTLTPEAAPAPRSLKRPLIIGGVFLAVGLWLVIALLPGLLSPEAVPADAPAAAESPTARRIQATLFFLSPDGSELVPVVRDVPYGATPAEQARLIVAAQVGGADGEASAIPTGTTVRGLFLSPRGEAFVDLSPHVQAGHTGGALNEALAVFAIVNAVTANLPDVLAVQILVDGKEVDSLAGHVDLREPIARANAWVRKGQ